jgi:hypothetical protein
VKAYRHWVYLLSWLQLPLLFAFLSSRTSSFLLRLNFEKLVDVACSNRIGSCLLLLEDLEFLLVFEFFGYLLEKRLLFHLLDPHLLLLTLGKATCYTASSLLLGFLLLDGQGTRVRNLYRVGDNLL